MDWKPDKRRQLPLYKQIYLFLESKILNSEYPPGSRLPSERELANRFKVNRSTVKIAFEQLQSTGLVNRIVGLGTVVNKDPQKKLPNWERYVKESYYQMNNPINQQIFRNIRANDSIINFAVGELSQDLIPIELLNEVCSFNMENHLGYENVQGNLGLREAISFHMKEYRSIRSTSSSILITSGAQQAVHLITRCLLKPGDSVAIEDPSYAYSLPIFHSEGIKTYLLPVDNKGINPEDIITLYKKHQIKMIIIHPNYQNPTGIMLSLTRRKEILDVCIKHGIAIVEQDPYNAIGYTSNAHHTLKSMDNEGVVLYVSSLSSMIASGLRIGWISGPQSVINLLTDVKQQIDFGQSIIPQLMATKLLNSELFNQHIDNLKKELKEKRDLTIKYLKKELREDIQFHIPEGGIHLWCKISDEVNESSLFRESIRNGVVFAPGSTLGSKPNHLLINYSGVNKELIESGIYRFGQAFKKCKQKPLKSFIAKY
ncbi:DNA-binding transcriptional regulator, MocR family, contains an aminotransferase domain [Priestia megaterium]|nr:DNA-binding transcriptional regulator, MocR family, contains an aminotransferase domain [Priestia megaterium]